MKGGERDEEVYDKIFLDACLKRKGDCRAQMWYDRRTNSLSKSCFLIV